MAFHGDRDPCGYGRSPAIGLGRRELSVVAHAMADVAPDWSVELSRAFAGEANLVIMPEDADDSVGPTFIIRRQARLYCLDQFHWDNYDEIGTFFSMSQVLSAVRTQIRNLGMASPFASRTRH